ncbi:NADH-ubiquinone oxidoreductase 12 kDa subunit, mitochondrial [Smittium culicis]|uniref:NADH-ubiquinone oxidoreductase 12 kDa subunit, mitochondrial n=2 Tax=Smittium culicis TaxID=133412 RepID=A0A1R1YIU1_9FUNG|nr:NADH-ubiquinone oxidoreductase 12 kDa subunit, mitochondrial [Smittium culicis]
MNDPKLFANRDNFTHAERQKILGERDKIVREQWIKLMETRIVREKLEECYLKEGVNHFDNCRELALRYLDEFPKTRIEGWYKLPKPE